jgi:DNA-binding NarL/FixJ family response regulator
MMTTDLPLRIVLADDHAVVRSGLRAMIATAADIQVVGEAESGEAALELVAQLAPDVVVMDLDMPGMGGLAATQLLAGLSSAPRVLILTMHTEDESVLSALRAGAIGFVNKNTADIDLVAAIRTVGRHESYLSSSGLRVVARGTVNAADVDEDRARFETLTMVEREIFQFVAHGLAMPEIEDRLQLAAVDIEHHRRCIKEKTGLGHRSEYIRLALKLGLLSERSAAAVARKG